MLLLVGNGATFNSLVHVEWSGNCDVEWSTWLHGELFSQSDVCKFVQPRGAFKRTRGQETIMREREI